MAIRFYRLDEPHGGLSNFSRHPIAMDGVRWPTVEHRFQAMKYPHDEDRRERIRAAGTPREAKQIAWEKGTNRRDDWDLVRDNVMLAAVRAKFVQNADARELLLSTGDEELIEHTGDDGYWGDGGDGGGVNKLGRVLMLVRAELRALAAHARVLGEPFIPFGYDGARTDARSDPEVLRWIERHFSWERERTDPGGVDWYGPNRYCGDDSDLIVVTPDDRENETGAVAGAS